MKDFLRAIFASLSTATSPQALPEPGSKVNYAPNGYVTKTDGVVVAADPSRGVLVDWPRGGSDWLPLGDLSLISG